MAHGRGGTARWWHFTSALAQPYRVLLLEVSSVSLGWGERHVIMNEAGAIDGAHIGWVFLPLWRLFLGEVEALADSGFTPGQQASNVVAMAIPDERRRHQRVDGIGRWRAPQ